MVAFHLPFSVDAAGLLILCYWEILASKGIIIETIEIMSAIHAPNLTLMHRSMRVVHL